MVYFVRHIATGHIKIGYTGDMPARMQDLRRTYGPIDVLATADGMLAEEQAWHRRFLGLRLFGEWFAPGPELLECVATMPRSEHAGPVPWLTPDAPTFSEEPQSDAALAPWLATAGDAAARGLPLRPPRRR